VMWMLGCWAAGLLGIEWWWRHEQDGHRPGRAGSVRVSRWGNMVRGAAPGS